MRIFKCLIYMVILATLGIGFHRILAQDNAGATPPSSMAEQSAITIGPGDLLDLTVFNVPELVLKVRVDSKGMVDLPLIGNLKLGGLTVREAQMLIAHELVERQMVKTPEVSLLIEEFATQGITVYGEVNTPGIYPLMGPHRLYDAISAAGGLTAKAGRTITIERAGHKDHPEVITLSPTQTVSEVDVRVYPGDTVVVSKAGVVYVLGEVNKPGAFLMENNTSVSLLKSIALAQGTTKLASLKHVVIFRRSPKGNMEFQVSLDKIYHGKASDPRLRPEDIVFVPLSNLKNYGAIGLQGAISGAVASIYVLR